MLHGLRGWVGSITNRGVRAIIPGWFMMKGIGEIRATGYQERRWRDGHSFIILASENPRSFRPSIAYADYLISVALASARFVMHVQLAILATSATTSFAVSVEHSAWPSWHQQSLIPFSESHSCPRPSSPSVQTDPPPADATSEASHYRLMRSLLDPLSAEPVQPEDCLASQHLGFPSVTEPNPGGGAMVAVTLFPQRSKQELAHCSSFLRLLAR